MDSADNEKLVASVKEKCRITWNDPSTDAVISSEIVPSGCEAIRFLLGIPDEEEFDFSKPGIEHRLFLNWCYYAWNDAEDDFQTNYAAEIAQARRRWEVRCAQREKADANLP